MCQQLAAYEFGGLGDFLDVRAEAGLIDQADRVCDWPGAQMGIYAFVRMTGPTLVVRDLASEEEVCVLNVGALSGRTRDECLLGRIVPITVAPGLMFESRPVAVDAQTAQDAATRIRAREPLGWLHALAAARDDGRLSVGFSCSEQTRFTSDLPVVPRDDWEQTPAPRIQDLMNRGHSHEVANAVGVLEVGLIAAKVSPDSVASVVPHLVAALAVPGAFEAAMGECASADDESAWIVLADATPEHVSMRCRELAARAARTGRPER